MIRTGFLASLVGVACAVVAVLALPSAGGTTAFGLIIKYGPDRPAGNPGTLSSPHDLAIGPGGTSWVADTGHDRVVVFDRNGRYLRQFATADFPDGIAVGADPSHKGRTVVYVASYTKHCVQKFRGDGRLLAEWGKGGGCKGEASDKKGEFWQPTHLAVKRFGELYVSDLNGERIQRLSLTGAFLAEVRDPEGVGGYGTIVDFAPDGRGTLWATYSSGGVGVLQLGQDSLMVRKEQPFRKGSGNGKFADAIGGIAVVTHVDTGARDVYIVDPDGYRVQKFDRNLTYAGHWPRKGEGAFETKPSLVRLEGFRFHVLNGFRFNYLSIWGEKGTKPPTTTAAPSKPSAGAALLHFDECSGRRASDSSPGSNDGVVVRAAWTPSGKSGCALRFAARDYVLMPKGFGDLPRARSRCGSNRTRTFAGPDTSRSSLSRARKETRQERTSS